MAEPLLYHTISTGSDFRSISRVLSGNPLLCSHVAVLHVNMWYLDDLDYNAAFELVKPLTSLQELTLDGVAHDFRLPSLGRLVSLRISFDSCDTDRHKQPQVLGTLAHVFSIPTLRKLQIDLFYLNLDALGLLNDRFPRRFDRTSSVTNLHLVFLEGDDICILSEILLLVKHLKWFFLEMQGGRKLKGCFATPLAAIDAALRPHASTLEELFITSTGRAIFPPSSLMGDLRRYTNLKRLGITESLLVQHGDLIFRNSLPRQLEEIQLQYTTGILSTPNKVDLSWLKRMDALAKDKHTCFPGLKFVACWDPRFTDEYLVTRKEGRPLDEMEKLVRVFKDVGVRFCCVVDSLLETP